MAYGGTRSVLTNRVQDTLEVTECGVLVSLLVTFRRNPFVVVVEGRPKQVNGRMSGLVSMLILEARVHVQPEGFPVEYLAGRIRCREGTFTLFVVT